MMKPFASMVAEDGPEDEEEQELGQGTQEQVPVTDQRSM